MMRTKGRFSVTVLGICSLAVMLATTGCAYRLFFHDVDVAVTPEGEPQMAYTRPVKKLLVTETVVQTKEGAVDHTQAVSDAFAKTGVEIIKPVQLAVATQIAAPPSAPQSVPADHVVTVTINTPSSPLGAGQLFLGNKVQSTMTARSEMMEILPGGATKTVWMRNYTAQVAHGINVDSNAIGIQIVNEIAQDWANHYNARK